MVHKVGLHPGAIWRKCDFQIHTPRDPQWSGSPKLPGGTPVLEQVRRQWADDFVAACLERGLTAIAVTDHHDFCFVEYVRDAIARIPDGQDRLWLYPGVEVTCNDSVQCLVLFDVASVPNDWNRLFGGHFQSIPSPDNNASTNPQAQLCGQVIENFITGIANDAELKKKSIVLPHAGDGGHKTIIRQGFHARFRELPFDGVYLDKAILELDDGARSKIHGKIAQWGSRRRGILPTGDNRDQSFERLGRHTCWIRLGEPTTEAIRQAVLADEARISYQQPAIPSQRLLGLRVKSTLTGDAFELSFNDGFTALIGGRGSGKSAILEYLRFGLGRSAADISAPDEETRAREKQLILGTLMDGEVVVELERDGVREIWTRTGARREVISAQLPDGSIEELTILAAQQRFRARAFYQKQLSSLATDRSKADEQITGIAAAETIDRRQQADQVLAAARREIHAAFQRVVEYWIAESEHRQNSNSVLDLRRRIEAIKVRLEQSGLSPEHQKLIDEAPVYNLISALSAEAKAAIGQDIERIKAMLGTLPSVILSDWSNLKESEGVSVFVSAIAAARNDTDESLRAILSALSALALQHETFARDFTSRKQEFELLHNAAAQQQAHLRGLIEESKRLAQELQAAESAERQTGTRLRALEDAQSKMTIARDSLRTAVQEVRGILSMAALKVSEMSGGSLRAVVTTESVPKQRVAALMRICDGHRIRDVQQKCEDRVRVTETEPDESTWNSVTSALMSVLQHKFQTQASSLDSSEAPAVSLQQALWGSLTQQQLTSLYSALDAEKVAGVLAAVSESYVSFEYRDARRFIPFAQASEGQQAAALLELLLRQAAGTLIIDQPEEDLDNRVIMRIAGLLQTTKQHRQLLFATHNPNFVVNGDADKVVALQSGDAPSIAAAALPRVLVEVDGAIETPAVRLAITDTMEGGREAFELRGRKYQFGVALA